MPVARFLGCDVQWRGSDLAHADVTCCEAGEFDLAWSMESGEHMPDKRRFVNELVRVTGPGGRVIIVTWWGLSPTLDVPPPCSAEHSFQANVHAAERGQLPSLQLACCIIPLPASNITLLLSARYT